MSPAGIQHVVVLVLENQSFDRMLGYVTLPDPRQRLEALTGNESNPAPPDPPVKVSKTTSPEAYVTDPGPGHSIDDIVRVSVPEGFTVRARGRTLPCRPTAASC